jgi:hypothetical protein
MPEGPVSQKIHLLKGAKPDGRQSVGKASIFLKLKMEMVPDQPRSAAESGRADRGGPDNA